MGESIKTRVNHKETTAFNTLGECLKDLKKEDVIVICIGTDKCIGDCLGPLVGTYLKESKFPFPVFGTIDEPIHALNLKSEVRKLQDAYPDSHVIAIDACVGNSSDVEEIHLRNTPVSPGSGAGKVLPKVGDLSIVGIVETVNKGVFLPNVRLSLVVRMAKTIAKALIYAYT